MAKGLWPVINVENVEKTVEFYNAVGLKAKASPMDMGNGQSFPMGSLDLGDSGLIIWGKHNMAPDQPADTKAWLSGDLGKGVLFTIGVPNAQKCWAGAQKIRAEVDEPLAKQPWGGFGFNIVDPDGYVLNISDKFPSMAPPKKATPKKTASRTAKKTTSKKGKANKGR